MRPLLLCIALTVSACNGTPTQPGVPESLDLRVGQSAVIGSGVRVLFDAVVSDSRCPIDAICVRAGEAVIALTLSRPGSAAVSQNVQTDPPDRRSATYQGYVITLSSLTPFPRSDRPAIPADYVATLLVGTR